MSTTPVLFPSGGDADNPVLTQLLSHVSAVYGVSPAISTALDVNSTVDFLVREEFARASHYRPASPGRQRRRSLHLRGDIAPIDRNQLDD